MAKMRKVKTGIGARANKALNNFMDYPATTRFNEGTATPQDSATARGWSSSMGLDKPEYHPMDPDQAFADIKTGKSSTAPRSKSERQSLLKAMLLKKKKR